MERIIQITILTHKPSLRRSNICFISEIVQEAQIEFSDARNQTFVFLQGTAQDAQIWFYGRVPPVLSKERNRQDFLEVKQITGTMEFTPGNGEVTFRKQGEQDIARSRGSVKYS